MTPPTGYQGLSFERQTAFVTGAAGGIGRSAARMLARRGAFVVCTDRDVDGVRDTARQIDREGGKAEPGELDMIEPQSVHTTVSAAMERHGSLDAVLNCVGITGQTGARSSEVPLEDFRRVLDINLVGAFALSQAVLPHMVERGYGRMLHVASIAGKEGNAGMVSYSASKAGLIGMVKSMGKEYAETGVTINALAPAVIRTELVEAMPTSQVEYMTSRIPMGRCGTLDEVAESIAWALSPAASFTTGFTFDLTGGRAVY